MNIPSDLDVQINFVCNAQQTSPYVRLTTNAARDSKTVSYYYADSTKGHIVYNGYSRQFWISDTYKTIQITGGADATNTTLIEWLQANGTLTKTT